MMLLERSIGGFLGIFSLLAHSPQERAVWLSFGFYLLNQHVPIVPAVIIYRLFPQGKTGDEAGEGRHQPQVSEPEEANAREEEEPRAAIPREPVEEDRGTYGSVEGNLAGWKIKAIGAWGAYVTAFLLGFWAIRSTALPLIKAVGGASVWKVESDFHFTDENGQEIDATVDKLVAEPPMIATWGNQATITVFSKTLDPPEKIRVKMEGYRPSTVDLKDMPIQGDTIKVSKITMKRLPPPNPSIPAPTPLPAGHGPPPLASTP